MALESHSRPRAAGQPATLSRCSLLRRPRKCDARRTKSGKRTSRTTTSSSARRARDESKGEPLSLRWLGRQLLHVPVDRLVARFQTAGGLSRAPRLPARGALRRIVAHRSAAAEALHPRLCQARRRARYRPAACCSRLRPRKQIDDRERAVSQSVRALPPACGGRTAARFTFEYNQRGHQVYRVIEVDAATGKARAVDRRRDARPSSTTTAARTSSAQYRRSTTARKSSGCRSATAGTISTCTTARPAR